MFLTLASSIPERLLRIDASRRRGGKGNVPYCGGTHCNWEVFGEEILADIAIMYTEDEEEASNVDDQTIRKSARMLC